MNKKFIYGSDDNLDVIDPDCDDDYEDWDDEIYDD